MAGETREARAPAAPPFADRSNTVGSLPVEQPSHRRRGWLIALNLVSRRQSWRIGALPTLAVALAVAIVAATAYGSVPISFGVTARVLLNATHVFSFAPTWPAADQIILLQLRLPRVAAAALVGAALATAGALFQGLLRNPLADPLLLGTSSGAALGATLGFALPTALLTYWLGLWLVAILAFAGALVAVALVYFLATQRAQTPVVSLLLAGVAVGALLTAAQTLLVIRNDRLALHLPSLYLWLSGGIDVESWGQVAVTAALVGASVLVALLLAPAVDAFALGEEMALHLGLRVERYKLALVAVAALLVAAAVSLEWAGGLRRAGRAAPVPADVGSAQPPADRGLGAGGRALRRRRGSAGAGAGRPGGAAAGRVDGADRRATFPLAATLGWQPVSLVRRPTVDMPHTRARSHASTNGVAPALAFANVSFAYGRNLVVDSVSLTVSQGERVGLIGPNGAGKSTLLRLATGALRPATGTVALTGDSVARLPRREIARRVAVAPQDFTVQFAYTARQIVAMGRIAHGELWGGTTRADEAAIEVALATTRTVELADRVYTELSGGERQRVRIALALAQESPLLLLDEPTAHLDIKHQVEVLELLSRLNLERGLTVVAALHDLSLAARYFPRLVLFSRRVVRDGSPEHVLDAVALEQVYETPVRVVRLPGDEHLMVLPGGGDARSTQLLCENGRTLCEQQVMKEEET